MKITIIGKGNVGSALQRGLERGGHDVQAVGNEPARIRDAAQSAEVLLLAVPFGALDDVLRMQLARSIGFDAVDAGPLQSARLLEPMGYQNIQLGHALDLGTNIGFRLVH